MPVFFVCLKHAAPITRLSSSNESHAVHAYCKHSELKVSPDEALLTGPLRFLRASVPIQPVSLRRAVLDFAQLGLCPCLSVCFRFQSDLR